MKILKQFIKDNNFLNDYLRKSIIDFLIGINHDSIKLTDDKSQWSIKCKTKWGNLILVPSFIQAKINDELFNM